MYRAGSLHVFGRSFTLSPNTINYQFWLRSRQTFFYKSTLIKLNWPFSRKRTSVAGKGASVPATLSLGLNI